MQKSLIAVIVALAVGIVGGALGVRGRLAPQLRAATAARVAAEEDCRRLRAKADTATDRFDAVRRDNETFAEETAGLRAQLDATLRAVDEPRAVEDPEAVVASLEAEMAADAAPDDARRSRRWPSEDGARSQRGHRESMRGGPEERREMMGRFQDNANRFLDAQAQQSTDPDEQERLAALAEYTAYSAELMQDLRDAETDEDRQPMREALDEVRQATRDLVREQRMHMLRETAAANGITDPDRQDAFLGSIQTVLTSPFFDSQISRGGFGFRDSPRRGPGPRGPSRP